MFKRVYAKQYSKEEWESICMNADSGNLHFSTIDEEWVDISDEMLEIALKIAVGG